MSRVSLRAATSMAMTFLSRKHRSIHVYYKLTGIEAKTQSTDRPYLPRLRIEAWNDRKNRRIQVYVKYVEVDHDRGYNTTLFKGGHFFYRCVYDVGLLDNERYSTKKLWSALDKVIDKIDAQPSSLGSGAKYLDHLSKWSLDDLKEEVA